MATVTSRSPGLRGDYVLEQDLPSNLLAPTDSTKQNDYSPTGLSAAREIRWEGTASIGLTGLTAQDDGREIVITNNTADYLLWLENENTASSAVNRFNLPNKFPVFLMPGDAIILRYVGSRWRVISWPAQSAPMGLSWFTDFTEGSANVGSATSGAGATATTFVDSAGTPEFTLGTFQLGKGTTTTGRAYCGNANNFISPGQGPALGLARLRIPTAVDGTDTFFLLAGFADAVTAFTDGVAWEYMWTGSAAEWSQSRASATTVTRSNTGSPTPTTEYIWCVVFMNANWSRADFIYSTDSIAFTLADSPTTGLPGSTRHTGFQVSLIASAGTTDRLVHVDLMGARVDTQRG